MTVAGLRAGDRLDRFTIVDAIGHGAFSDVYLAEEADGRRVVLKLPHEALLGDVASFDRFRREMEIVRQLDHPGIQHSYDLGEDRTRPYLVLEYVDGVTLREVLRRDGRLSVPRAVDIAEQMASAMASAHARGICHRDLKPENVLVTPEGRVVITDFGIALMAGARRLTWRWLTSTLGTPDYMAPEQVEGRRGDARTDVYALGVMLFSGHRRSPSFHGHAHVDLGLVELRPGLDGLLRRELVARSHDVQRRRDRAAHRVDVGPRAVTRRAADGPLVTVDLPEVDQLSFREVEERRGEPVLGDRLGADVLGLDRAETWRRRVLHGKPRRRFDGGPAPEVCADSGSDAQAEYPRHAGHRPAENSIPRVVPRQAESRRGRQVNARAKRDRGARFELRGGELHRVSVDRQVGHARPTPGPTEHWAPVTSAGSVAWTSTRWM